MISNPLRRAPCFGIACFLACFLVSCKGLDATRQASPERSSFETEPEGASLFIDGGFVGTTPTRFFLPAKPRVQLRIQRPGYLPVEETLIRTAVGPDQGEGVGWEPLYFFPLTPKRN